MTDADALSELVRAGLRNPAKVVVKVQSKKTMTGLKLVEEKRETIEERRIPARYFCLASVGFILTHNRITVFRTFTLSARHQKSYCN